MALTKSVITGRVPLPTDVAAKAAELIFTLSAWDTQGADVIAPATVRAILGPDASLPIGFALWRNTEGLRGSHYIVTARWTEEDRSRGAVSRETRLGNIQIGDDASYTLAVLLERGIDPAPPSFWVAASAGDVQTIVDAADALSGFTEPGYLAEVEAGAGLANGAATRAEAAADAALGAAGWDQSVPDEAARLALTGLPEDWRVYQIAPAPGRIWRWTGSAWADTGENPLAGKADKRVIDQTNGIRFAYGHQLAGWILDENDRVALGWSMSGKVLGKLPLSGGLNNVTVTQLPDGTYSFSIGTVEGLLPVGTGFVDGRAGVTRYIDGVQAVGGFIGTDDRWPLWIGIDGKVRAHGLTSGDSDYITEAEVDAKLVLYRKKDLLMRVAVLGDSLTAPGANTTAWANATGLPVVNRGIGGQQSRQISARLSGYVVGLTLADDQIVSGANVITAMDGNPIVPTTGAWASQILSTGSDGATRTIRGRLGSVVGVMTRSTTTVESVRVENYTFTPDAGQALPVNCPPASAFTIEHAVVDDDHRSIAIIHVGRNDDWTDPAPIIANIASIVERLRERGNDRFVIMTPPNGNYPNERKGQTRYLQLLALEQAIQRRWPQNTFNTRRWLIDRAMAALGIAPTTEDQQDITDDTVPQSLRVALPDRVHWLSIVYAPLALAIKTQIIDPKGWLS